MTLPLLYHVTSTRYDRPLWEKAEQLLMNAGEGAGKNAKGILGLWISPLPGVCMIFGAEVAQVTLANDFKPVVMGLEKLKDLSNRLRRRDPPATYHEEIHAYSALRSTLLAMGDVLFLLDANEAFGEVVVLNYDVITGFDFLNAEHSKAAQARFPRVAIPDAYLCCEASGKAALLKFDKDGMVIDLAQTSAPSRRMRP